MYNQQSVEEPDTLELRIEANKLETQLSEYISQKASLEKLIQDYNYKFYTQVGDLMSEVNRLKLEKLRIESMQDPDKQQEYTTSQQEFDDFDTQYKQITSQIIHPLTESEQKLIKSNFRKASFLCHPDSVSDEFQDEAARIFVELKDAYDMNDLSKVSSILERLENSLKFPKKSDTVTDKDRFTLLIDHLRSEIQKLKDEIEVIKRSDIYRHITTIGNWDIYISHIKKQLEIELARLKSSLSTT